MPIDDDVEAFRVWAAKLGCPPDAMPSEDALKSVFKSRERNLFCDLMRRVRPRQEVKDIKANILIHKVEKVKGQVVSIAERSFLPLEMQMHLKVQDLQKKKEDLAQRVDECKKEYEALSSSIKTKNIQLASLEYKCDVLEAKVHMLDFKSKAFDKDLKREEVNMEKIKATMPVVLTHENKSEEKAMEAVKTALKTLEGFYALSESDANYQVTDPDVKQQLWSNVRKIFANIPNFLIFNSIMRLKEDQLQHIMALNKTVNNESHLAVISGRDHLSNFEINILKSKSSYLGTVCKYLAACEEHSHLENEFIKAYEVFEDKLMEKVKIFNADSEANSEEIMRNYVVQYNIFNVTKGQNEYLSQHIDLLKAEIEKTNRSLENHEVLLGNIKQVYSDINESVNRIQYDMKQLSQIKDKIMYSKNIMKYQFEDLETNLAHCLVVKSSFKPPNSKVSSNNNMSLLGVDSFEMSNDNVFSSTKLEFDSTMLPAHNTTLRQCSVGVAGGCAGEITHLSQLQHTFLPPHSLELMTFYETPLEHLSCLSRECSFYISHNPLLTESRELSSTVQLAPGILLTPFGALQEVRNRVVWADLIAQHSNELKSNLDTFLVDPQQFKLKAKQQHDRIIESIDKIDVCSVNTVHSLQKLAKLYDFLIENPLRHFIPPSKNFNNQSYAEYEAELTMYIRMATIGNPNK